MSAEQEVLYSNTRISQWMDDEIAGNVQGPDGKNRTPLSNFFNGRKTEFDPSATHTVHWQAFPKRVSDFWGLNTTIAGSKYLLRWAVADSSRIYQDEYLEWSVAREPINVKTGLRIPDPSPNPINKQGDFNCDITSISFTCEGPEYWQFFTAQKPEEIVAMYKKYNASIDDPLLTAAQTIFLPFGDGTDLDSLYKKGVYNPCNNYNFTSTSGTIMHLIHPSNTLGAEVDIAAQGTVIRKKDGAIITDPDALINCSKYGNLHRNSDPKIGSEINTAVIGNKAITVQDPVALYMQNPDLSFLQLDYSPARDGSDLRDIPPGTINFTRGDWANNRGLRIDIAVPNTEKTSDGKRQLNVSDIFDTSPDKQLYIHYAAQIADYLEIAVTVNLISREAPEPQACPGAPQASVTALGTQMTVAGEEPERKAFLSTRRF